GGASLWSASGYEIGRHEGQWRRIPARSAAVSGGLPVAFPMRNFRCGRPPDPAVRMDRYRDDPGLRQNRAIPLDSLLKIKTGPPHPGESRPHDKRIVDAGGREIIHRDVRDGKGAM